MVNLSNCRIEEKFECQKIDSMVNEKEFALLLRKLCFLSGLI